MADPEEIVVVSREGATGRMHPAGEDPCIGNHKNWSNVDNSGSGSSSGQNRGNPGAGENGGLKGKTVDRNQKDQESPQGALRAQFYEHYRTEAKEYDEEFMKKYDDDLGSTLIFAGLFSTVTSAFIILVHSEFKPDPNEETAALLRVLIYKLDNTSFGGNVPTVPQWTGPPRAMVQVQAILVASLAASLFSALLATLGKQWLNRYASIDMRGSVIERSQNRQRKLDGIVNWYFDHVMGSLPVMLQAALLLLGCALSRYIWEFNTTVASVILGVTSFGVLFYLFIIVVGAASVSCPYQTPGAHFLRQIIDILRRIPDISRRFSHVLRSIPPIPHILRPLFLASVRGSIVYHAIFDVWDVFRRVDLLMVDIVVLCWYIFWSRYLFTLMGFGIILPVVFVLRVFLRLRRSPERRITQQMVALDLHCISWTLRTSLDKSVRLLALSYLTTMTLVNPDPAVVIDCFDILIGCIRVTHHYAEVTQGSEELAAASALCCLHILSHLSIVDPKPKVLEDIRRRYTWAFSLGTDFSDIPFSHILCAIHHTLYPTILIRIHWLRKLSRWIRRAQRIRWEDYRPPSDEHIKVAHALTKLAHSEYQRRQPAKVPRWILRFALHSLSQDPSPPASVVTNCLSVIAMDLGCDYLKITDLDESAREERFSSWITLKFKTMVEAEESDALYAKRNAVAAIFPYAVRQERDGQPEMLDVLRRILRAVEREGPTYNRAEGLIATLRSVMPPDIQQILHPSSQS